MSLDTPIELKIARVRTGITQWQLSRLVDIPPYMISRAERGTYELSSKQRKRIRKALQSKECAA